MKRIVIVVAFILYGTAVGFISIWFREHTDTLFWPNIPGSLLGDVIYGLSIKFLGDPNSAQAHYTIPWVLRIPQVYVPVSLMFWGLLAWGIQLVWNKFHRK